MPEILTEMQIELRRDREAKLLAAGRPVPRRDPFRWAMPGLGEERS